MDQDYSNLLASFSAFNIDLDNLEETPDWDQVEADAAAYTTLLDSFRHHVNARISYHSQLEEASAHYHDIIRRKGGEPHEDLRRGYDTTVLSDYYEAKQELVRLALARDQAGLEAMKVAMEMVKIQEEHGGFAFAVAARLRGKHWRAERGFP